MISVLMNNCVFAVVILIYCTPVACNAQTETTADHLKSMSKENKEKWYMDLSLRWPSDRDKIVKEAYRSDPDFQPRLVSMVPWETGEIAVYHYARIPTDPPTIVEYGVRHALEKAGALDAKDEAVSLDLDGFSGECAKEMLLAVFYPKARHKSGDEIASGHILGCLYCSSGLPTAMTVFGATIVSGPSNKQPVLVVSRSSGNHITIAICSLKNEFNGMHKMPFPLTSMPSYLEPEKWPKPLGIVSQVSLSGPFLYDRLQPISASFSNGSVIVICGSEIGEKFQVPYLYRFSFLSNHWDRLINAEWKAIKE